MFTCYYYWLLEPMRTQFSDPESVVVGFEADVQTKGRVIKFALLLDRSRQPIAVRFSIPAEEDGGVPDYCVKPIQSVKEHFLSVLKLNYDLDANYVARPIWNFRKASEGPNLAFSFSATGEPDVESLKHVFASSHPEKRELKLFVDGQDRRVPLQFRFLSLFHLIEVHFRPNGKWDYEVFDSFFENFEARFLEFGYRQKPRNVLFGFRDRCAHLFDGDERFGISQLSIAEAVEAERLIGIQIEACAQILNIRASGRWKIGSRMNADGG